MDLPNVTMATTGNLSNVLNYGSGGTYETVGGTYQDAEGAFDRHTLFVTRWNRTAAAITANNTTYPSSDENAYNGLVRDYLIALDDPADEALAYPFASQVNSTAKLERIGIDLDETGSSLSTYKSVNKIYPQIISNTGASVNLSVGASDVPNSSPVYTSTGSFNPATDYQFDVRASGRYLAYKLETTNGSDSFELTGFDAEFIATAKR